LNSQQTGNIAVTPAGEATTATLVSTLNPSTLGQTITLSGTVHGTKTTPTGTGKLMQGAALLGSGTLAGGVARFTFATLPVGNDALTFVYGGDATHQATTSPALNQNVLDPTTITLTSTPNPSILGQEVAFIAAVQGQKLTPSGQVQLKRGSVVLATAALSAGKATFTITTIPLGTSAMAVTYWETQTMPQKLRTSSTR
jgi:hypothetical protein